MTTSPMIRVHLGSLLGVFAFSLLLQAGCPKNGNTNNNGEEEGPPDPEIAFQDGIKVLDAGGTVDYERALKAFAASCQQGGEQGKPHSKACFNAGLSAARLGRFDQAETHYRAALKGDPGFKAAVQNLTVALLQAGKSVDSLPIYEDYLKKNPKDWEMVNNYAGALGEAGRYPEAVSQIQAMLFEDPKNTRAYKTLARIYFLQGNYRMSQLASANALKLAPDDADIHNNIGLSFLKEGKEADAVIAFKEALKLDEGNLEANMNLGLIAVKFADYALAAQCFNRVLAKFPGNAEARVGIAVAHRGAVEMEEAIAEYDAILQNDKCNELALINKGIVQTLFLKKHKEALATFETYSQCPGAKDVAERVARVKADIAEEERVAAEQKRMEEELRLLEEKAKRLAVDMKGDIERARLVFEKYKAVEQDPSWRDVLEMQIEALQFAIESESPQYMEEQRQYMDEFMVQYYKDALAQDPQEWLSRAPIVVATEQPAGGGEGTPPGGGGGSEGQPQPSEPAPQSGEAGGSGTSDAAPSTGEAGAGGGSAPAAGNTADASGANPQ
jgi:tetratricopeptide (TPR) repeat protein